MVQSRRMSGLHLRNVGDASSVLGGVDEAEVIRAWSTFLEICSEDVGLQKTFVDGGVEECGLWLRCNFLNI